MDGLSDSENLKMNDRIANRSVMPMLGVPESVTLCLFLSVRQMN